MARDSMYDEAPAPLSNDKQPQGSISYVSPGDVVSANLYDAGTFVPDGHVLIVSAVSGSTVTYVSQNEEKNTAATVTTTGTLTDGTLTVRGSGAYTLQVIGVVHAPGGTWGNAIEVPGTAALNTGGQGAVSAISCASAGNCSAGGAYTDSSGQSQAFVVSEVNGAWGNAIEVPGTAGGGINSISCASAGNCSAGGVIAGTQAFVVSEVNGTWGKAIEVPGATAPGIVLSVINSISCGSPGNCSAGGLYQKDNANQAFVVSQTNGTWGQLTEVPGTAALNTGENAEVNSVSCGSAGNCSAGGGYEGTSSDQAFVVSEINGTWGKAIEVPGTATLNTAGYAVVTSVSCASAGNCSTGGLYSVGASQEAFVADQVDGTWRTAIEVPGSIGGAVWLTSVSCGSPGNCGAGGYYGGADGTDAFVVNETDGTWGTMTNVPGGASDEITTMSCASAGNCSAGGYSTGNQAFVVSEVNGTWGTVTAVSGAGTGGSKLESVSCPTPGTCGAGGGYTDSSGQGQAFVVSETAN